MNKSFLLLVVSFVGIVLLSARDQEQPCKKQRGEAIAYPEIFTPIIIIPARNLNPSPLRDRGSRPVSAIDQDQAEGVSQENAREFEGWQTEQRERHEQFVHDILNQPQNLALHPTPLRQFTRGRSSSFDAAFPDEVA